VRILIITFLLTLGQGVQGEAFKDFSAFHALYVTERMEIAGSLSANIGTHINGIGAGAAFSYSDEVLAGDLRLGLLEAGVSVVLRHYASYLGIPGPSDAATGGVFVCYGLGEENRFPSTPFTHAGPGRHNFFYRYNRYLTTDGTSQATGRFGYEWAGDRDKLKLQVENDRYSLPARDEFRTAAGELEYLHAFPRAIGGVAAGYMLWTGATHGLRPAEGTDSFDLTGQLGDRYSHGIVFVSLIWGIARLSVGYDSEAIRDALQNTAHRLTDYYTIPKLERKDRWFFQVSLFSLDSLYQ
jgi:hypothetical protein